MGARRCGSVLVRALIHRLRARGEVMPVESALALAIAMARRVDDVGPRRVTPAAVLVFFDGRVELAETLVGTPEEVAYVPPEQLVAGDDAAGVAGAVFGVGAILYELLTGVPAFARETEGETRFAVLCDVPVAPSAVRADVPAELDEILAAAMHKDHDVRHLRGVDLAEALEAAAARAGLVVSIEDAGKLGRRLAQGVRLAHTLHNPVEDRSTRRMQLSELRSLGAEVDAVEIDDVDDLAPPVALIAFAEPTEPAPMPVPPPGLARPSDGLAHTFFLDDDGEAPVDADHDDDAIAPPIAAPRVPVPTPTSTDRIRRSARGPALAIGSLLLVAGVVAFAAVPVFEDPEAPAAPSPLAQPAPQPVVRVAPPAAGVAAPAAAAPAPAPAPAPVARVARTPAAAARVLRAAVRRRDWAAASAACGELLGRTSSRRVRASCAIAACRAGDWPQHDAFVDGLSRSRKKRVARACASGG